MAGVSLSPETASTAPMAIIVGLLIAKTGKYRWSVWTGWVFTTTGMGLLTLLSTTTSTVEWIFLNLVSGVGLGILYPALSFSVQASASNADLPFAAAMFSFFRAFGQMLGVAIGGAVFQNEMKKKLLAYPELAPMASEYSRDSSALVQIIKAMPASQALTKSHLVQAYVDSLRVVWIVMCALSGLALITSILWIKDISLERELETEQGFIHDTRLADSEATLGIPAVAAEKEKKRPPRPPRPVVTHLQINSSVFGDLAPVRGWGCVDRASERMARGAAAPLAEHRATAARAGSPNGARGYESL